MTKAYKYLISSFFLTISVFLCFLSVTTTCYISTDYREHTFFLTDKPLRNTILVMTLIGFLFIIKKFNLEKKLSSLLNNGKVFYSIKYCLLLLIFALCTIWIYSTRMYPYADQYDVQNSVLLFKHGDYSAFLPGEYMSRNAHQIGLFSLSYLFSLVFGDLNIMALQMVNAFAVVFIYKSLSEISTILFKSRIISLFIILSALIFPVLIFYCYFIYGNLIGIAFGTLAIKYELLYFRDYRFSQAVLSSILIMLGVMAKSTFVIYMIAMLIYALFKIIDTRRIKSLLIVGGIIICFIFQSVVPRMLIENTVDFQIGDNMSYWSYVAMGLQEGDRAPGWYNGYNNDSFASVGHNKESQKEIAIKDINYRLTIFINDSDYAIEFLTKKIASEWNNPTYQVFWNIQDRFMNGYTPSQFIVNFISLTSTYNMQKIMNIFQMFIMVGTLIYAISSKTMEEYLLPLTFVGGFLFLSFLSEAKAQYTIMFFVLLIPCGIAGYKKIFDADLKIIKERINRIVILILLFSMLVCWYNTSSKKFMCKDDDLYFKYVSENGDFDYMNPGEYY